MSGINDGIVSGIAGCADAIATVGALFKNAFGEQAAYVHGNKELQSEMDLLHRELEHALIRPQSAQLFQVHARALASTQSVPEFRQAAAHVTNALQAEHEAIALEIAPLVAAATKNTAFETVQQVQSPGRVTIIGQDQHGKALQTEILTAPGKPLEIRSETLGFNDDTCDATLTEFEENLETQGVTINPTRRTATLHQRLRSRLGVRQ